MNDIRIPSSIIAIALLTSCGGKQDVPDGPATAVSCPEGTTFEPGASPDLGHCVRDGRRHGPALETAADYGPGVIGVGNYADGQREGLWVFTSDDGHVASGMYVAGQRHGEWRFGPDDTPSATGTYALGEPQGEWTYSCRQGTCIGQYDEGNQQTWRWTNGDGSRRVFFDGGLWRRETLDAAGDITAMHVITDPPDGVDWLPGETIDTPAAWLGQRPYACSGPFREYYEPGKTARLGNCKAGELDGTVRTYAATGGLVDESNWDRGVRHGQQRILWTDGSLRRLEHRAKGKLDGPVEEHTASGVQLIDGAYHEGKPTGAWQLKWANGKKRSEGEFFGPDAVNDCLQKEGADEETCAALLGKADGTWRYWHPNGKRAAVASPSGDSWKVRYWGPDGKSVTPPGKNDVKSTGGSVSTLIEAGGQARACMEQRPTDWPFWQLGELVVTYDQSGETKSMTIDPNRVSPATLECLSAVKPPPDAETYVVTVTFGKLHPADTQ